MCTLLSKTGALTGNADANYKCFRRDPFAANAALKSNEISSGTDATRCYSKTVPGLADTIVDETGFALAF